MNRGSDELTTDEGLGVPRSPQERILSLVAFAFLIGSIVAIVVVWFGSVPLLEASHRGRTTFLDRLVWNPNTRLEDFMVYGGRTLQIWLVSPLLLIGVVAGGILVGAHRNGRMLSPVNTTWRRSPARYRVILIGVIAAMVIGHFAEKNSFPLVHWTMYTRPYVPAEISTYHLFGVEEDGNRVHVSLPGTMSPARRGIQYRYDELVRRVASGLASAEEVSLFEETSRATMALEAAKSGRQYTEIEVVADVVRRHDRGDYTRRQDVLASFPMR